MKPSLHLFRSFVVGLALLLGAGERFAWAQTVPSTNAVAAEAPDTKTNAADAFIQNERSSDVPNILSDFVLEKDQIVRGDKVVIKGSAIINGVVSGNTVVVMGDATITGKVEQDLVVVLGNAKLGPQAVIGGNLVVVGGSLERAPGAKIGGEQQVFDNDTIPGLSGFTPWLKYGLALGRPLVFSLGWPWLVAGVFLLLNLLLQMLFPRPIQACVDMVEKRPVSSFFIGILSKLLIGLVFALLIVSVVGIIAIPFLFAAAVVGFLFGKITIYRYAGQQLGRQMNLPVLQAPALALILGTAIFYLLYAVPFLGFLVWGFTGLFGMGAVMLATFQQFRSEKPKTPPPVPYVPVAPEPQPQPQSEFSTVPPTMAPPMPAPLETALLPRAGFWIRLCALFLDAVVFMIPAIILSSYINHPEPAFILWLAYHVGLWTWKGTTIGGIVMGIKLVRVDGRRVDFAVALIRALSTVLSAAVLGLGFFWAGFSAEKQSWHDKIAGTVMVKVPRGMSLI